MRNGLDPPCPRATAWARIRTWQRRHHLFLMRLPILLVPLEDNAADYLPQLLCHVPRKRWEKSVPGALLAAETRESRCLKVLVRADIMLAAVSFTMLAVGLALTSEGTLAVGADSAEPKTQPETIFAFAGEQTDGVSEPDGASARCATFDERFYPDRPPASFDERFASAFGSSGNATRKVATVEEHDNDVVLQQPDNPVPAQAVLVSTSTHASARDERLNAVEASTSLSLPLNPDAHTAIYDIAARTVYLPGGHRLEAHSGLGSRLDDPRYVRTKMQGPTPPNVYNLTLRERLFHGVRAIRLVPADDGKMFGRDGILAHSYMLGPSGQSNGCVSFRNYPAFLNAFLKGEVNRLVVVDHLATTAVAKASPANGS